MNAEIVELNDHGMPEKAQKASLEAVPRIGELIAFGDRYFEVVNVIHQIRPDDQQAGQTVGIFVRPTKSPYLEPKSRFGFSGR